MKAAILTLFGNFNFGNKLQNYALQETLKKFGYEVTTIPYNFNKRVKIKKQFEILKYHLKKGEFSKISDNVINKIKINKNKSSSNNDKLLSDLNIERENKIKKFSKKYINEYKYSISDFDKFNNKINKEFSKFIVGSDQVWNPNYIGFSDIFFLKFADKCKRISYSASFGVSDIPEIQIDHFKNGIGGMNKISVREEEGANIIEKLTGKRPKVVLDPTLLLNKDEWTKILEPVDYIPEKKYIFTYFLGNLSNEKSEYIEKLSKNNNFEIVDILNTKTPDVYVSNPAQFLSYINSCEIFFTDSFHGCVFSILFNKPFVVFDRNDGGPSMSSRIDTLLRTFNLEDRKWDTQKNNKLPMKIDYKHIDSILEREKEYSIKYLKDSLK